MPQPRILISRSALEKNLRALIKLSGNRKAFPVLKGNAYGIGFKEIAHTLGEIFSAEEIPYFCLARMKEVEQAVQLGVDRKILLLSEWPSSLEAVPSAVELCATSFEDLEALAAHSANRLSFHLKLNTGMNRLGLRVAEILTLPEAKQKLSMLFAKIQKRGHRMQGIASHLAVGDERSSKFSAQQASLFQLGIDFVQEAWREPVPWLHLSNSPGVLNKVGLKISGLNAFRPGIHLWGARDPESKVELSPVVRLCAPLRQLYWIEKGESVGYGCRFLARKKTRVGILNIGYADGIRRDSWTQRLAFYVNGERAPLLGVVSMDMCAVDCTRIRTPLPAGTEFEWINEQQSLEKIAKEQKTITYEVLTSLAARIERVVV